MTSILLPRAASCRIEALESRKLLTAIKIMPLGDSITEAIQGEPSYRFWLWKHLSMRGYDTDFVGSRTGVLYTNNPPTFQGPPLYTDYDQNHEGHAGWTAEEVLLGRLSNPGAGKIATWAPQSTPDVVLMHLGTNDMTHKRAIDETIEDLDDIIDTIRISCPNVVVVVAKLIPIDDLVLNDNVLFFNAAIPALVAAKNTAQSPVVMVDQYTGFDIETDLRDPLHPNLRGERKMQQRWLEKLVEILTPPVTPPPSYTYLSDIPWVSATNGFGPVERDWSNGDGAAEDGGAIWLNNVTFMKGLGTRAASEVIYNLAGGYARFQSSAGVDDDVDDDGTVRFRVFVDGIQRFDSGVMTNASTTQSFDIDVAGANTLRLLVSDGGDGTAFDHGDWANARLRIAPTVASSNFAYLLAPQELSFTFRGNVSASLSTADILLENLTTSTTIPTSEMSLSYNSGTDTATVTFPNLPNSTLPDGRYRVTILAAGVSDAAGNPMLADYSFNFFFLRGDANHDALVNLDDYNMLAANYGLVDRDFSQGDFNYDTIVNLSDFNILTAAYGTSLPAAAMRASPFSNRQINTLRVSLEDSDALRQLLA